MLGICLCNAGDTGLTSGWGTKIPHATEPLSPCTTTAEQRAPHLDSLWASISSHVMQVLHLTPDTTNKLIYYSMSILFFEHPENLEAQKKKKIVLKRWSLRKTKSRKLN